MTTEAAMELSSNIVGALLIILSLFLYYYFLSKFISRNPNAPPEAGGAWPFIGHLHLMGGRAQLPHVTLGDMVDKYGPIFSIQIGVRRAVVVSTAELAKELFTTHDVAVSSRPKLTATQYFSADMAMIGFTPYGPYWRELRKLISSELLSAHRMKLQRNVLVSETAQAINELYQMWSQKADPVSGRATVEMKVCFGDLNLNAILRLVVGRRCNGTSGSSEEARLCQRVMRDFSRLLGTFVARDALPCLGWLDIGGYEKQMQKTAKEMDLLSGQWLQEHKEKAFSDKGQAQEDFMDVLLSVIEGKQLQSHYDADTVIKYTCLGLILGADSTTSTLVWALSLLLNNSHALKKAQQELDHYVGKERRVDESDMGKLSYLQSIVKETLRLYPSTPLNGMRVFSEDCTVGGYHVQKGTQLILNGWKLQRDPQMWPDDPSDFRPERFLTTHKDVEAKGRDFELIPFGAGRRICPRFAFWSADVTPGFG